MCVFLRCRRGAGIVPVAALTWFSSVVAAPGSGQVPAFTYPPIPPGTTVGAALTLDLAEFNGHRTVGGHVVNTLRLIDVNTGLPPLDLSEALFGNAAPPAAPRINQRPRETGLISVPIDQQFFPALESGAVGLSALLTDTVDGLFAIDTILLTIDTESLGTFEVYYGSPNDGYRLGIADNADLPGPLPGSLPPTGTGFDEPISSKSIYAVPEPGSAALLAMGLLAVWHRSRRRTGRRGRLWAPAPGRAVGACSAGAAVRALSVLLVAFWLTAPGWAQVNRSGRAVGQLRSAAGPVAPVPSDPCDPALVGLPHVPGEVLVIFEASEEASGVGLLRAMGAAELARYEHVRVHHVRVPVGWTVSETVVFLAEQPEVLAVSPNYIGTLASDHLTRPNDPGFAQQWYLDNHGRNLVGVPGTLGPVPGVIDADIDAAQAWEHGTDCSDIIIAVFDSGLDVSHRDIAGNIWVNPAETPGNNRDDDDNGVVDDMHGASFAEREMHAERLELLTDNNGNGRLDNADTIYWDADFDGRVSAADEVLAGRRQPNGTAMFEFRANWKHTDNNANQVFDDGESIYEDADDNNKVSAGDTLLFGPGEDPNTPLVPMRVPDDKLQPGEPIYFDADASGTVTVGDSVLSPAAVTRPNNGAVLVNFAANERFVDSNDNGRYDTGEPVYRDNNGDGLVDAGDEALVGNAANGSALVAFGSRPRGRVDDLVGHGTSVAGVIAARGNNNTDIAGVCWRARVMVLRVANARGQVPSDAVVAAINYVLAQRAAGQDVRLANLSLGFFPFHRILRTAMNAASDVTFVVAAGNEMTDNDPGGQYSEPLYIDRDNSGSVTVGDTRLTPFGQPGRVLPAGPVQAVDADLGRVLRRIDTLLVGPAGRFRHDETVNANNRFDAGEMMYIDVDNDRRVSAGDQRRGLIQIGNDQFGRDVVQAADPDVGTALVDFRADERFWDRPEELPDARRPEGQAAVYPCAYNLANVVCVAASNSLDRLADFSAWGDESVEVVAPGVDILTLRRAADGGGTRLVRGTSFATPIVTGIFAHAWTRPAYDNLSGEQIRRLVLAGESPGGERFAHGVDPRFGLRGSVVSGIDHDGRARMVSGADFGDAPDPPYPTAGPGLFGGNPPPDGPRHEDFGEEWLGRDPNLAISLDLPPPRPPTEAGADVSGEFEAFDRFLPAWPPDPDGRDNLSDQGDAHDDGVELLGPFVFSPAGGPARRARVRIWIRTANAGVADADTNGRYAGAAGHGSNTHSDSDGVHRGTDDKHVWVNGWFDWNRDGDWDDAREHVLMLCVNPGAWPMEHRNAGVYEVEFDMPPAPANAQAGELWARFRLDYGENAGQDIGRALGLPLRAVGPSPGGRVRLWNDGSGLPLPPPAARPRHESIAARPPGVRLTRGVAEFGECEDYQVSGDVPDQLHLIGPTPNEIRVGQNGSVVAVVSNRFVGLAQQTVTFTRLAGNFSFLNGSNPGGASTDIDTGPDGHATVNFRADGPGSALLRATVTGESGAMHAFAVFEIVAGP